jgi:hypothetical protein
MIAYTNPTQFKLKDTSFGCMKLHVLHTYKKCIKKKIKLSKLYFEENFKLNFITTIFLMKEGVGICLGVRKLLGFGEPRLLERTKRSQYTASYPNTADIFIITS